MATKIDRLSDCDKLFCECKKKESQRKYFCYSNAESYEIESIAKRLKNLPKVYARPSFDQKMAAAFAMELERETLERNRSWLKKNKQISLPQTTADLIKDLF